MTEFAFAWIGTGVLVLLLIAARNPYASETFHPCAIVATSLFLMVLWPYALWLEYEGKGR